MNSLHFSKILAFCILSSFDLILTNRLIQQSGGQIYESNPIARAWLHNHGWAGLAFFKLCMVFVVVGSALFISKRQPQTGGRVLVFACLVVASVVCYSWKMGGSSEVLANQGQRTSNLLMRSHAAQDAGIYQHEE